MTCTVTVPPSLVVPENLGDRTLEGLLTGLRVRRGGAVMTLKWTSPLWPVPLANAPACSATAV